MAQVLFIVTSHGKLGNTGKPTGLWLEELAAPWFAMQDAGHLVTLASPLGGRTPVDPNSIRPGERATSVERFLADTEATYALDNALSLQEVHWQDYDAIFLPGGHGTMWDLPGNTALAQILSAAFAAGRIIAAVCHGPAGLVGATAADGRPLAAGRQVACFTDAEEQAAGLVEVVPFLLASRLAEQGAKLSASPNFEPHVVRDGNLITGQNPASSEGAASKVLIALAEKASRH